MGNSVFKESDYTEAPVNMEIYNLIPDHSIVLDVGCGEGKLLNKLYNEKYCDVYGIDKVKPKNCLFSFTKKNIEKLPDLGIDNYYPYIIFADVLEHLAYPDKILLWIKNYLPLDGEIILSIPNIAYWQIRLLSLCGKFHYNPGLLDWGHLRFFTLSSIKQLLDECGYEVTYVGTRNKHIGLLAKIWKELFAFQFIIKARKR